MIETHDKWVAKFGRASEMLYEVLVLAWPNKKLRRFNLAM